MSITTLTKDEIRFHAEDVLEDCRYAILRHTEDLQGEDFRLSWWTIVSLLRAVGHVLSKIDTGNPRYKGVIENEFKKLNASKAETPIFWEFIVSHRNTFLKEYKYSVSRRLKLNSLVNDRKDHNFSVSLDNLKYSRIRSLEDKPQIESTITSGYFQGQKETQVALMALSWWGFYLGLLKIRIIESEQHG